MELLSIKVDGVFDDGNGRLFPAPLMLIPACVQCMRRCTCYCDSCGLPLCESCLPCSNCVKTPEDTPRTIIETYESGETGSTNDLIVTIIPSPYETLQEEVKRVTLEWGTLVKTSVPLGECFIEDEITGRYFGTSIDNLPDTQYIHILRCVLKLCKPTCYIG